jgi:hypothetical protein
MVTLLVAAGVLAHQIVPSWEASAEGDTSGRMVAALMTVLVVFCMGVWAKLAQTGKDIRS